MSLTIKELKAQLADLPDDMLVILQKDAEGNGYSPLEDVDGYNNVYVPDSTWSGDCHLKVLTAELKAAGYGPDDVYDGNDAQDCVILCPVN